MYYPEDRDPFEAFVLTLYQDSFLFYVSKHFSAVNNASEGFFVDKGTYRMEGNKVIFESERTIDTTYWKHLQLRYDYSNREVFDSTQFVIVNCTPVDAVTKTSLAELNNITIPGNRNTSITVPVNSEQRLVRISHLDNEYSLNTLWEFAVMEIRCDTLQILGPLIKEGTCSRGTITIDSVKYFGSNKFQLKR